MKRRLKRKLNINNKVIAVLAIFLAIGFAYITSAVNIGGVFTLFKSTWDIHFENVQVTSGSVSASTPSFDSQHPELDLSVSLTNPGDFYEFTIDAVNNGDIDGMLDTFSDLGLTEEQLAYLKYTVTYVDGEELAKYQELNAGDTCTFKIRIEFRDDIPASDLPSGGASLSLGFDVSYVRADSNRIRRRAENTLYNVLKTEAESGGLAKKYTGAHQDSMDASKSTKDIYHWYSSSSNNSSSILDKNNVLFGGFCWQMIRTTDTGGVKLIYNGEPVNGKCLNDRNYHVGYGDYTKKSLNSNYWYGTSYNYDSTNNAFSISGTTTQITWNDTTYNNILGKYTCLSTSSASDSCTTLYYASAYMNSSTGYLIPIVSNTHYSQIGKSLFNYSADSPAPSGYMYGELYDSSYGFGFYSSYDFSNTGRTYLIDNTFSYNYYYANSVSYDSTSKKYTLVNPYLFTGDDYSELIGKYTVLSSNSSYSSDYAYHIAGIDNNKIYSRRYRETPVANLPLYYYFGDSITDNGNGTYTLNNATAVSGEEWYNNYSNYIHKYTCDGGGLTCSSPVFTIKNDKETFFNFDATSDITIAKTRTNLTLNNAITIKKAELLLNKDNYSDYKYTCKNTDIVCTADNIYYIKNITDTGLYLIPNYIFAKSVTYDGSVYHLNDTISLMENHSSSTNFSNYHFLCNGYGNVTCSSINYIYYINSSNTLPEHIEIKDGITTISDAFHNMFENNVNNSAMKNIIEYWYKEKLLNYNDYIDDTIFCSDRSVESYGGWIDGGNMNSNFKFKNYSSTKSLQCEKMYDRFSISNNLAKLDYPVGLVSKPELQLMNNSDVYKTQMDYWTISPSYHSSIPSNIYVSSTGGCQSKYTSWDAGIRPAISLSSSTFYTSGDGSMESPYVIYTE